MTKCTAYKIKHIKETSYSKSGYMMYIHSKKDKIIDLLYQK